MHMFLRNILSDVPAFAFNSLIFTVRDTIFARAVILQKLAASAETAGSVGRHGLYLGRREGVGTVVLQVYEDRSKRMSLSGHGGALY